MLIYSHTCTSVEPPTAYVRECLDEHNRLRALHGVHPLRWSNRLADEAKRAADRLAEVDVTPPTHSADLNNEGENIGWHSIAGASRDECNTAESCFPCRAIIDDWYGEIQNYGFEQGESKNGGIVNHFTQVVWRTTSEMGFGTAIGNRNYYYVARYYRRGNLLPTDNFVRNVPPLIKSKNINNTNTKQRNTQARSPHSKQNKKQNKKHGKHIKRV